MKDLDISLSTLGGRRQDWVADSYLSDYISRCGVTNQNPPCHHGAGPKVASDMSYSSVVYVTI